MNDDRLLSALRGLADQELPRRADRVIRGRLETAWVSRSGRTPAFAVRRLAPVLAVAVLALGLGGTALGAGADSPLWDARIALESGGALLRLSADDRVGYVLELVRSRTEEAARQEAAGNAGAAAKARAAAAAAVIAVAGSLPRIDAVPPTPLPPVVPAPPTSPATSSAAPSRSPLPSSVPAAQPTATPPPVTARTVAPTTPSTPVRSEPPHTPTPSATTRPMTAITGTVRDAAGGNVTDACVTTSPAIPTGTSSCIVKSKAGAYGFSAATTPGQTITLYAFWMSPTGEMFGGSATATATAPTTVMPAITLTLRK
jgi:hypothetical protein